MWLGASRKEPRYKSTATRVPSYTKRTKVRSASRHKIRWVSSEVLFLQTCSISKTEEIQRSHNCRCISNGCSKCSKVLLVGTDMGLWCVGFHNIGCHISWCNYLCTCCQQLKALASIWGQVFGSGFLLRPTAYVHVSMHWHIDAGCAVVTKSWSGKN